MRYQKIEVDEKVWGFLKSKAEPFEDTPNSVLNRILFGREKKTTDKRIVDEVKIDAPSFPHGVPQALTQILEVVYEMRKRNITRTQATNRVAKRRGTAPQTVLDKYCRQLNKKAYEIDRLLQAEDFKEFKLLLENKFIHHKDTIHSFFQTL